MASENESKVGRTLTGIGKSIASITRQCKVAEKQAEALDKALALDPTNITLTTAKAKNLETQLSLATKQAQNYHDQEEKYSQSHSGDSFDADKYAMIQTNVALADEKVKSFGSSSQKATAEVEKTAVAEEKATLNGKKLAEQGNRIAETFTRIGATAIAVLGGIYTLLTKTAEVGKDIGSDVRKYGGTAEEWQERANEMELLTGETDAYKNIMSATLTMLGNVQKQAPKTKTELALLGLTFEDMKDLSSADALALVSERLREIPDDATRASISVSLLGDAGKNLTVWLDTSSESLEAMDHDLSSSGGLISNSSVAKAEALNAKMEIFKKQIQEIVITLGTSLSPVMDGILETVKSLDPLINSLSKMLEGLNKLGPTAVSWLAGVAVALPVIANGIKIIDGMLSMGKTGLILSAIALGATAIGSIITSISSKGNANEVSTPFNAYSSLGSTTASTSSSSTTDSHNTIIENVTITENATDTESLIKAINVKKSQMI